MNFIKSKFKCLYLGLSVFLALPLGASATQVGQSGTFQKLLHPTSWGANEENINISNLAQKLREIYKDKLIIRIDNNGLSKTLLLPLKDGNLPVARIDLFPDEKLKTARDGSHYIEKSHFHIFDDNKEEVNIEGKIVSRTSPDAHIPVLNSRKPNTALGSRTQSSNVYTSFEFKWSSSFIDIYFPKPTPKVTPAASYDGLTDLFDDSKTPDSN